MLPVPNPSAAEALGAGPLPARRPADNCVGETKATTRYLRERTLFGPLVADAPADQLGIVVVIPAKDEEAHLIRSLESLRDCDPTRGDVEVVVVVNSSETDSAEIVERERRAAATARDWAAENSTPRLRFQIAEAHGLPRRHAGVGLARKIGMDEACRRLEAAGNPQGVIACFDADSRCDANYLTELEQLFQSDESCQACGIYFEHPIEGDEFAPEVYAAAIHYELHLRYTINAQKFAGFPFATQTIGSSMAARCDAYQAQNGMNRRQAGEDFYFLHKFTPLGHVAELTDTRVIPSPRVSHRVPFGTGKAVAEMLASGQPCRTYSTRSFVDLRTFFSRIGEIWRGTGTETETLAATLPESVRDFLQTLPFAERIAEIRENVTDLSGFRVRFFRWFNAFQVMKFLHHTRDRLFPDEEVAPAARWLLRQIPANPSGDTRELLRKWRALDRAQTATFPALSAC